MVIEYGKIMVRSDGHKNGCGTKRPVQIPPPSIILQKVTSFFEIDKKDHREV